MKYVFIFLAVQPQNWETCRVFMFEIASIELTFVLEEIMMSST